jgi:hypothetical protein
LAPSCGTKPPLSACQHAITKVVQQNSWLRPPRSQLEGMGLLRDVTLCDASLFIKVPESYQRSSSLNSDVNRVHKCLICHCITNLSKESLYRASLWTQNRHQVTLVAASHPMLSSLSSHSLSINPRKPQTKRPKFQTIVFRGASLEMCHY